MQPICILLVDDSPKFLEIAGCILSRDPRLTIVGRALSGHEALRQVTLLRPDLVLIDLAMPKMSGLETTRRIKASPDPPRVVVLTVYHNPEYRTAAEAVGADGFVVKSEFFTHLPSLIQELCAEPAVSG